MNNKALLNSIFKIIQERIKSEKWGRRSNRNDNEAVKRLLKKMRK